MPEFIDNILDFLLVSIPVRLRKTVVLDAFKKKHSPLGRVLLYYKTDSFFSPRLANNSVHTNDAEIIYMLKTLDQIGFVVDLLDRSATESQISEAIKGKHYKIFISNLGGNSAPFTDFIKKIISFDHLIAYVMGPEPILSCNCVQKRHDYFEERTGVKPVVRRLVLGGEAELEKRFLDVDAFITNGKNFSLNSYKKFNKPIYRVPSTISEKIKFNFNSALSKKGASFLFFGGNGLICKGLDLVLEAFDGLQGVELHVCGPPWENDFWGHYQDLLKRNPHIHYHGFVKVGSPKFYWIMDQVSFNLFPSSSEGCATSVLTAMRAGVIPVVSYESDVDVEGFGFELKDCTLETLKKMVENLIDMPDAERKNRIINTYLASLEYKRENFVICFQKSIFGVLGERLPAVSS